MFMPRFLHLWLICTNVSSLFSVLGENVIVIATTQVYRLVNTIWKKSQRIVHNSSHDLYSIPARPFRCFCWQRRTAIPPVYMYHFVTKELWKYISHFDLPIQKYKLICTRKRHFYRRSVFPRGPPFLNCLITFRMVSCGRNWNALLLFSATLP